MKSILSGFLVLFASQIFAAPTPLNQNVELKNEKFSELIYTAMARKVRPVESRSRSGERIYSLGVPGLINCQMIIGIRAGFRCTLLQGGWLKLGGRQSEIYSVKTDQHVSAFYNTLGLKIRVAKNIKFKDIELNVPKEDGDIQRNILSCSKLPRELEEAGFRNTCEIMNGL